MQKVVITGPPMADEAMKMLRESGFETIVMPPYSEASQVADEVAKSNAAAIIVRMGKISEEVIAASNKLRVISKHGAGYDNIEIDAATRRGIPVTIARGGNANSVAELGLALILALNKNLLALDADLRNGKWEKPNFLGVELSGKCLGIVGMGEIGQALTRLVTPFDLQIVSYDPAWSGRTGPENVRFVTSLEELLQLADFVSLNCPLNSQTRGLIGAPELALMKKEAFLVNTSRGSVIEESALVNALRSGDIAGAGLDGFEIEPPAPSNPLWNLPNTVFTPHIGGVTAAAALRVGKMAAQNVIDVLTKGAPDASRVINPEALQARSETG